jgi:probable addiction module antidote protein
VKRKARIVILLRRYDIGLTIRGKSMSKKYRNYEEELSSLLQDLEETVAYLNAALQDEDPAVFLLALRDVIKARNRGIAGLAEESKLNRENLYRVLSKRGNPTWKTMRKLLNDLDLPLSITFSTRK